MPTSDGADDACKTFGLIRNCGGGRTGLGKRLMGYLMDVADNIASVDKVMLTCFVSNASGLEFYEKLGFERDDYSPRERKLRGGKVVMPDYVILSRPTASGGGAVKSRTRRRPEVEKQ